LCDEVGDVVVVLGFGRGFRHVGRSRAARSRCEQCIEWATVNQQESTRSREDAKRYS
jgi:hypothetical protein